MGIYWGYHQWIYWLVISIICVLCTNHRNGIMNQNDDIILCFRWVDTRNQEERSKASLALSPLPSSRGFCDNLVLHLDAKHAAKWMGYPKSWMVEGANALVPLTPLRGGTPCARRIYQIVGYGAGYGLYLSILSAWDSHHISIIDLCVHFSVQNSLDSKNQTCYPH